MCYRDGRARRITGEHGLGENTFYQALDDGRGHLWLTSNGGIIVVELADLEAFLDGKAPSVGVSQARDRGWPAHPGV